MRPLARQRFIRHGRWSSLQANQILPRRRLMIDLHYWPTPNGWKISIMLEECGLPYVVRPIDISKGDLLAALFGDSAAQPDAGHCRSGWSRRTADLGLRVRRHPAISRPQDRQILSRRRTRTRRRRRMA